MTVDTSKQSALASEPRPPTVRQEVQLIICALGIYACYLRYGFLQERIYSHPYGLGEERFHHSSFLLLVQTLTNAAVALLVMALGFFPASSGGNDVKPHSIRHALPDYFLVALSYLSAMMFSFTALRYMSYPIQALGKSCKMIPVMLMGMVIRKRRYSPREFLCVGLITLGVALFSWKSSESQVVTSPLGFALLFGSLFMDGVTGPMQERLVARHNPTTHQLMFWQNICSSAWLAVGSVVSGEAQDALQFVIKYPSVMNDIMLFSLVSAIGQNFIFYTVRNFNALVVTTITTTRKMFTVLLSIFYYNHAMSQRRWTGLALVFTAITWEAVAKQRARNAKQTSQESSKKEQ